MFAILCAIAILNMLIGFFVGYILRFSQDQKSEIAAEKEIYCHGYEDGFYLGLGDYVPELFRQEIAERAYHEYRGIKYGPAEN